MPVFGTYWSGLTDGVLSDAGKVGITDTNAAYTSTNVDGALDEVSALFPTYAFVSCLGLAHSASGGMDPGTIATSATPYFGGAHSSNAGNTVVGNFVEYDIPLKAGTYTVVLYHLRGLNRGIYTLSIDGVDHGTTVDGYDVSGGLATRTQLDGVSVPTTGTIAVRWEVTDKNASSTFYIMSLSAFEMTRTGA